MRALVLCAAFVAAVVAVGCGDVPRSRVHGTVKYQGKPLADATLIFLTSDNMTHTVDLKADGTYELKGVPRGAVKVSIQQTQPWVSPRADPDPTGQFAAQKGAAVKDEKAAATRAAPPPSTPRERKVTLPAKYADPKESGLGFDLTLPDQEWSIDLQ